MPVYSFIAITEKGREYRGREEAVSEVALEARFRKMGHWIATASEVRTGIRATTGWSRFQKVPARVLTEFFLQLAIQLRAGIPLLAALANEGTDTAHPALQSLIQDLVERVQAGQTFSSALESHPKVFTKLICNLVKAGEASGKLPEACSQVREYLEWHDRLMADVRQAMTYPLFVLICALLFVVIVFTFLVPRFATLLKELNVPLPFITQLLLDISQFMVGNWKQLLGGTVIAFVAIRAAVKHVPMVGLVLDEARLRLPVFGELWRMIALSRFTQNLSTLYQSGIPLMESLKLVSGLTGSRVLEAAIADLRRAVNEGRQMNSAMGTHNVFSGLVIQMVALGENSGSLGTALQNVADYYNEILPRQIKRLFSILEPLMILGMVGFVGIVALSIFLPIVSLLSVR